jgi:beta-lactamase class D
VLVLTFAQNVDMTKWIPAALWMAMVVSACSPNNVIVDDSLQQYFNANKVTGCFGFFDNGQGKFTIYNLPRFSDSAYLPASTFKVVNSLIGIESGAVQDTNSVIKWDSISRGRPECDRDMTMWDAFRISCPPWYQEMARRVGKEKMQKYLDTLGYSQRYNKFKIGNNLDTFWLDNSAKVTADEQLGLVKKLYFDQLPFQKRSQRIVRSMMLWENNTSYKLSYKTGWGYTEKGHSLGWIIGWIEENNHPYFFVLQIETPDKNADIAAIRLQMLKAILKQYGFFQGRK